MPWSALRMHHLLLPLPFVLLVLPRENGYLLQRHRCHLTLCEGNEQYWYKKIDRVVFCELFCVHCGKSFVVLSLSLLATSTTCRSEGNIWIEAINQSISARIISVSSLTSASPPSIKKRTMENKDNNSQEEEATTKHFRCIMNESNHDIMTQLLLFAVWIINPPYNTSNRITCNRYTYVL